MLELTNTYDYTHFYLQSDLIESIYGCRDSTAEIHLTTGRIVTCLESPHEVTILMEKEK